MKVTLAGPDELGRWVLHSPDGLAYPLVKHHEDHIAAAKLFGWPEARGITGEEEIIQDALDWLMDRISDEIEAPQYVIEFFRELDGDE
jgi:hypothetical protein